MKTVKFIILLKHLKINNFALIDELDVSFSQGMTTITGETGAGKSILLGGLFLVLGKRADLSSVMDSTKKCVVEAVFNIENYELEDFFADQDLDYEAETIIRREIIPSGKSRAFINDTPVTLKVLEKISQELIDIHSQNETQTLLQSEYQFLVLDAIAQNSQIIRDYGQLLKDYLKIQKQYNLLFERNNDSEKSLSFNRYLFDELVNAKLTEGMQEPLEQRVAELSHVEALQTYLSGAIQLLEGEQVGILDQFIQLRSLIVQAAQKSKNFESISQRIHDLIFEAEDIRDQLNQDFERLELNPEELMLLEERLNLLNNLFQKHKVQSVNDLIQLRDQLEVLLDENESLDETLNTLKAQMKEMEVELERLSSEIRNQRQNAIPKLEEELKEMVYQMGMTEASFRIELSDADRYLFNGKDLLEFNFLANKGSSFKPLRKVASGGEISRIMLSIKTILSRFKKLPTIIFDEIDTGVSGKVSESIAKIMADMALEMQVFAITHLPQVAAKGKHHFKVFKQHDGVRTQTQLTELSPEDRINEIALMLSGDKISSTALAHAKELLN